MSSKHLLYNVWLIHNVMKRDHVNHNKECSFVWKWCIQWYRVHIKETRHRYLFNHVAISHNYYVYETADLVEWWRIIILLSSQNIWQSKIYKCTYIPTSTDLVNDWNVIINYLMTNKIDDLSPVFSLSISTTLYNLITINCVLSSPRLILMCGE